MDDPVPAAEWMQMGLHIVTPNKKFGAGPLSRYLELKQLALKTKRQFMYEVSESAQKSASDIMRTSIICARSS